MVIGSSLGVNTDEVGIVLQGPTVYIEPVVGLRYRKKIPAKRLSDLFNLDLVQRLILETMEEK
ncbi:hypothetical protein SRRS_50270 [Sporomusa rhizae]|uniref:hypothetical protein n=1 Tax=Sporomusa rhizae TaxID=357999 RepID=UPI00352B3DC0